MKKTIKAILAFTAVLLIITAISVPAFAADSSADTSATQANTQTDESTTDSSTGAKAIAAGILIAMASSAGAIGMAIAIKSGSESIARQPEAAGGIRTNVMLGLVFIETAIIYALIVAILIVFVL